MQDNKLTMLSLAGALVLFGCASSQTVPQVTTTVAPTANFANYSTYSWASTTPPGGIDPVRYQAIMSNLDTRLAAKGYSQGNPGDMTLVLTLGKRTKIDLDAWNQWGYADTYAHTEGEVDIDAFDTKTKQALWHGRVTDVIKSETKPDPARIDAALISLTEQFPAHH